MPSDRPTRVRGRWHRVIRDLVAIVIATAGLLAGVAAASPETEAAATEARILVMVRMEPVHFRPDVDYGDGYAGRAARAARQRTARAIARAHGLQLLSQWPMPSIGVECYEMQLPHGASLPDALDAIARDERAAWAQPMHVFSSRAYSDPLYSLQPTADWQLHRLHGLATGRGVLIAQVDSGVELDHPDLRGQFHAVQNSVGQTPYAAEQHGTAVAGIIVARADNALGIVGVAPAARLLVLRGCREGTAGTAVCDTLALAKALQAAIDRHARIVNLSVGGPPDRLLGALLDAAFARGMIVVAAANADPRGGGFPASHAGVIAVTDTAAPMRRAALAAAGTDVPTTLPGARWGMVSGSSFAAAAVSGLAALLLELQPGADARQIELLLGIRPQAVSAAVPEAPQVVDACRSVSRAAGRCACDCGEAVTSTAMNPTGPPARELVGTRSSRGKDDLASP